jgi:hypothetical protein
MPRCRSLPVWLLPLALCLTALAQPHPAALLLPAQLDTAGQIDVDGRSTPYLIRRLPQTYEAHRPENVIHASLERAGSDDWALLCSVAGRVSLLVSFGGSPENLVSLISFPETSRLQPHLGPGPLGFNWGLDPASPAQVHQAQAGLSPRPSAVDHDALADSTIERKTIYRYYVRNVWTRLEMPQ